MLLGDNGIIRIGMNNAKRGTITCRTSDYGQMLEGMAEDNVFEKRVYLEV